MTAPVAVFTLAVLVHTSRPFRRASERMLWCHVAVPDDLDDTRMLTQARTTAHDMAHCHPHVVQIAAVTLIEVVV